MAFLRGGDATTAEKMCRQALVECLRRRRHYGTTGGRMHIDLRADFPQGGTLYHDDPALGPAALPHEQSSMTPRKPADKRTAGKEAPWIRRRP